MVDPGVVGADLVGAEVVGADLVGADGTGAAGTAEQRHSAQLVPCPDGPILVRGDFEIVGSAGTSVDRGRRTIALCRCGLSSVKPFCDGSHKISGFRTEPELP